MAGDTPCEEKKVKVSCFEVGPLHRLAGCLANQWWPETIKIPKDESEGEFVFVTVVLLVYIVQSGEVQ